MSPPQKRCCHFCYTSFLIQDIDSDGAVPPRVIACTQCGKRWREKSFIRDDGRLHTILIPEITSVDVSGMDKPLATVMGVDDMPRALRDSTQGGARAGRMGPDVAFDESPCGFDGTEVMRVRRQIAQRGAPCLDQASDVGGFVRFEVVDRRRCRLTRKRFCTIP